MNNLIGTAFGRPPKPTYFVGFLLAFEAEDLPGIVKAYDELDNTAIIVTNKWLIPPWDQGDCLRLLTDYQILQLGLSIFSALPAWDTTSAAGSVIETFEALLAHFEEEGRNTDKSVDVDLVGQIKGLSNEAYQRLGLDWWSEFAWRRGGGTTLAGLRLYQSFMDSIKNFLTPEVLNATEISTTDEEDVSGYVCFINGASETLCHPFIECNSMYFSTNSYVIESFHTAPSSSYINTSLNEFVSPGLWTLKTNALSSDEESSAVQHSYLRLLRSEGILPVDPLKEQDWSGWGQHVEFSRNEKNKIRQLLPVVGLLGRSSSAKVESVRCKRIILARKTVWCNKRFTKEMALQEVAHLHKLEHPHVVRLIGTYSLPDKLAILLYPAAEMNLEDFFKQDASSSDITTMRQNTMLWAFRCLSNAIAYIHSTITKHMDIKPQNILVRDVRSSALDHKTAWKVYIADFGIARSYPSLEASETEGPTMFTRKYAAPEVLKHDVRGLSADVFSLGCVFVEMITFLMLPKYKVGVGRLIDLLAANEHRDASYQANITVVRQFLKDLQKPVNLDFPMGTLCRIVWRMIDECPNHRPTAEQLASRLKSSERCCSHATGLEPLEAASEK